MPVLLPAADREAKPWKNGGGVTFEVAVHPPGAGMDDFAWRISSALVATDGPFSRFDGVDRVLTVLTGEGLGLVIDGAERIVLTPASDPLAFPGDAPVEGDVVEGTVIDLNIMVRRGAWTARVTRRPVAAPLEVKAEGSEVLVWAEAPVDSDEGRLGPADAVRLSRGESLGIRPGGAPASILVVELDPLA